MHGNLLRMGRFRLSYRRVPYRDGVRAWDTERTRFLQKADAADSLSGSGGKGRSLGEQTYSTESVCMKPSYCIASAPSLLEFNDS